MLFKHLRSHIPWRNSRGGLQGYYPLAAFYCLPPMHCTGTAELAMSRACTIATSFHGLLSILSKNTLSISENLNSIPPPDYQIPAFTAGDEKSPYIYWTLKR